MRRRGGDETPWRACAVHMEIAISSGRKKGPGWPVECALILPAGCGGSGAADAGAACAAFNGAWTIMAAVGGVTRMVAFSVPTSTPF